MRPAAFTLLGLIALAFHTPAFAVTSTDGIWLELAPLGPYNAVVFDTHRNRLVGMSVKGQMLEFDLAAGAGWYEIPVSGPGPGVRYGAASIYHPVRRSLVLTCGGFNTYLNDLWELNLTGEPAWARLADAPFQPRSGYPNMAWDPARERILLFGGHQIGGYVSDVWAITPGASPTWKPEAVNGVITPRIFPSWVVDPVGDRAIVFGGHLGSDKTNETWSYSLAAKQWQQISPPGNLPTPRYLHHAVVDALRNRMLIYGGGQGSTAFSDLWELPLSPGSPWVQITPGGDVPGGSTGLYSSYNPLNDAFQVLEGMSTVRELSLADDVWQAPIVAPTAATATAPPQRSHGTLVADPLRDRTLQFGGRTEGQAVYFNDVWVQSMHIPHAWSLLATQGTPPAGRAEHSAIMDPVRNRMIVYSGHQMDGRLYQLTLGAAPTWSQLLPGAVKPPNRRRHSAVHDPNGDRMIVFGGAAWQPANDTWALDLATDTWTQLATTGALPPVREGHAAVFDATRNRMIVFGGYTGGQYLNDVWALDLGTLAWSEIVPPGAQPVARSAGIAVYDPERDRMVVGLGADANANELGDVWALPLAAGAAWSNLLPGGAAAPDGRRGAAAVYDAPRHRLVVAGGASGFSTLGDTWSLVWTTPTVSTPAPVAEAAWTSIRSFPNPSGSRVTIRFELPRAGEARVAVYDLAGRRVASLHEGPLPAGTHETEWNGNGSGGVRVAAGVYFAVLETAAGSLSRRLVLVD